MKTRIGQLQHKFLFSGTQGHKSITNDELQELYSFIRPLGEYMHDRGDTTMRFALEQEAQRIADMMRARGMEV